MFKSRKAEATTIVIIAIVIILSLWLVNFGRKECRTDRNCGKEYYCASDFQCHEKEKIILEKSPDYVVPSLIIAAALVISAVILRFRWERKKKKPVEEASEEFKYY